MIYVTYENRRNPLVTIHCHGCKQIAKHGGVHKYSQGHYNQFNSFEAARIYAINTKLLLKICSFCKPPECNRV